MTPIKREKEFDIRKTCISLAAIVALLLGGIALTPSADVSSVSSTR